MVRQSIFYVRSLIINKFILKTYGILIDFFYLTKHLFIYLYLNIPIKHMIQSLRYILFTLSFILFFFLRSYSTVKKFNIKVDSHTISNKNDTTPPPNEFNFFVSNSGSDSNDGRSAITPKLKIGSIETLISNTAVGASGTALNLDENSLFREEYDPVNNYLHVTSFSLKNSKKMAKITGMDIIKEWDVTPANNNVCQHLLQHSLDINSSGYSYIMVAEIDTVLERTKPVSAVNYLTLTSSIQQCNSIPGTYYTPNLKTNPVMIYMHPTKGVPGRNKFRYEATTRNSNINGFYIDNSSYEHLFLQTSAYGYGLLSAGRNTMIKNIIFQGGGIHHTVVKSGQIDSCMFLAGPKGLKDRIAAVFYNAEGTNDKNKITNSIFLDVPNAIYTHTNGEINHKSLVLDKVYAFADTTDAGTALSAADTDSIDVSNCYTEGYPFGWNGGATKLNIKNSIFRNTSQSGIFLISKNNVTGEVNINNSLITTNGNDINQNLANGWTAYGVRSPYKNVNIEVSNTIFHCYSTWHGPYNTVTTFQVAGLLKAHHNIYICDANDNNSLFVYNADNSGGRGTSTNVSSNFNTYIILRGSKFIWFVSPNINNERSLSTLSEWQALTGQDKNSIIIDLRNNPLGLKAVFVDPDYGNWTLTQTIQADSIRKISGGITNPPLFYPKRPLINNDSVPFKIPGGFSSFNGIMKSESESVVKWQTFNESEFSSFIIEYSLDGSHFMEAGSLQAINDNQNNNYQYVHTHQGTDSIFYRLRCIYTDSTISFSKIIKLYSDFTQEFKITIYPNPFQQAVTVEHPRRNAGQIRIYDYDGKLLKIEAIKARSSHTVVSLSNLPAGRYFIQWNSNQEKLSGTIVK